MRNVYEQILTAVLDGIRASPACPSSKSSVKMKMSTEHWWNGTDRGKLKYWDINLSQCHCVHHKRHTDWPGIEPGLPRLKPANSRSYLTDSTVHKPTQCTTATDFSSTNLPVRTGRFCHSAQTWKAHVQLNSTHCTPIQQFCSSQRSQTQR